MPDLPSFADILDHPKWRHRIPLGSDLYTPGRFGSKWTQLRLPEDMSGKSMLIVGANDGIHAFEAEARGAEHVLATDIWDSQWLETEMAKSKQAFDLAHSYLNSDVESLSIDAMDISSERVGSFDIVLCASVFTYFDHPYLGIKNLGSVTNDRLVIYSDLIHRPRHLPIMKMVGSEPDAVRWEQNKLCMKNMLLAAEFSAFEWYEGTIPAIVVPEITIKSGAKLFGDKELDETLKRVNSDSIGWLLYSDDGISRVELESGGIQGWVCDELVMDCTETPTSPRFLPSPSSKAVSALIEYGPREFASKAVGHILGKVLQTRESTTIHALKD